MPACFAKSSTKTTTTDVFYKGLQQNNKKNVNIVTAWHMNRKLNFLWEYPVFKKIYFCVALFLFEMLKTKRFNQGFCVKKKISWIIITATWTSKGKLNETCKEIIRTKSTKIREQRAKISHIRVQVVYKFKRKNLFRLILLSSINIMKTENL